MADEEPAKKRRKQAPGGDGLHNEKNSVKYIKKIERANDPTLFPQVSLPFNSKSGSNFR
jgi:hypothetical protein